MNEITTRILDALVLLFAVVLAVSIIYNLLNRDYETETAIYAEISEVSSFQGVYVRDETVASYSGQGAVRYCVTDGAKLGVGSVIAEVYSSEEQIDLRRRIADKEAELSLLEKIENPGTSEYAQPANLSALIQEHYKQMLRFREQGNFHALAEEKSELTVLMSTYGKITGTEPDFSSHIQTLQQEITSLEAKKSEPFEIITASESAYFVSYVDGYESVLTVDTMRSLSPQDIAAVNDDGMPDAEYNPNAIGKLINGYAWYIVGVFDNTKMRLSEGDRVKIRLESVSETISTEVVSLISAGNISETQITLRCEKMTYDVVQHRTERVELLRDTIEGVKIPRSAIRFQEISETVTDENGSSYQQNTKYMGVYVLIGENAEFRKLDIIYEGEDFYLSALNAGTGYVALYDDIIVDGVMANGS
ncbi:MAG: hypothetical protein IKM30_00225 [Oscillospiraceae bacterium]|nr:hypothetical protein [Oscillospiraceae bacterium]